MAAEVQATFCSYSREDSEFALRLAADLKAAGAEVWIDQLDIEPGKEWDSAVEAALTECPRMLLILSPSSVASPHVRNEITFALHEQKTIVPVLYQECKIPLHLHRIQQVDFRKNYAAGLKVLVKTLGVRKKEPAARQGTHRTIFPEADANASQKLLGIEDELRKHIIAQDGAVSALARAIRRAHAGFTRPNRPVASLLVIGPPGTGKTELARSLAVYLFSEKGLLRFDMSDYMEKYAAQKLIGTPPGYVGHEEGGHLTERVRQAPYSLILLEKIEHAHPDAINLLLRVLEEGEIKDAAGNLVDFRNTILVMTSNIGTRHLLKAVTHPFQPGPSELRGEQVLEENVRQELKRVFGTSFLDNIDEIVVMKALQDRDLITILQSMVQQLNGTLARHGLSVALTERACEWILSRPEVDRTGGARPLRRALQKYVEDPLSEGLIQELFRLPASVEIFPDARGLYLRYVEDASAEPVLLYAA